MSNNETREELEYKLNWLEATYNNYLWYAYNLEESMPLIDNEELKNSVSRDYINTCISIRNIAIDLRDTREIIRKLLI